MKISSAFGKCVSGYKRVVTIDFLSANEVQFRVGAGVVTCYLESPHQLRAQVRCGSLWTQINSKEVFLKEFLTNRLFPQVPQTDLLLISTSATSGVFFNVLILNYPPFFF